MVGGSASATLVRNSMNFSLHGGSGTRASRPGFSPEPRGGRVRFGRGQYLGGRRRLWAQVAFALALGIFSAFGQFDLETAGTFAAAPLVRAAFRNALAESRTFWGIRCCAHCWVFKPWVQWFLPLPQHLQIQTAASDLSHIICLPAASTLRSSTWRTSSMS